MDHKIIENTATCVLCVTIAVFFCTEFILNLTPPISRDALVHHLAVPKLWIKHGCIYEIPWAEYSYYPMFINLFYLVCLYFKNDIAPKFIHLTFGLATAWLIYLYLKQKFDRNWGLLGMLVFFTTPIVVWLSTSAYVDLGMTFFTTGSILALIKWRDSEYNRFEWFLISSLCMGIAIGSKYNALIAWFIINLMLMYSYVRDRKSQLGAIQFGMLFFAITAIAASPWYLKNYFQTGNPFYPLFDSFFNSLNHHPGQKVWYGQAIEKTGKISFFKMREVMYGESFWEILLIPIRMFFQGEDNSYQYFQGSLNPILILFLPFLLLRKRYDKDKFLFISFSVIFIIMAFFLTAKQVRYILPVLPFLSILCVMAIQNCIEKLGDIKLFSSMRIGEKIKTTARLFVFSIVIILLIFNLVYLKNRTTITNPFPYVLGKETKEAFLKRHLSHYDAVKYINKNLPVDVKIFTMFLGRRGYYLDRAYQNEPSFGMFTLKEMVNRSDDEEKFLEYIKSMNVTHILMRTDLANKYLQDNFSTIKINSFLKIVKKNWKKVYEDNTYLVWDIQNGP